MIQKATVRVGDMIGNPGYPKAHFKHGMVIVLKHRCILVLTDAGKREWYSFDYVYCSCELLSREDKKEG